MKKLSKEELKRVSGGSTDCNNDCTGITSCNGTCSCDAHSCSCKGLTKGLTKTC